MLGEFRFRQSELVCSRLRQQKSAVPCLDGGSSRHQAIGQKDLGGSCLGRREVGDSRLRWMKLGDSMPTVRYKEGRLLQVVSDRARRLQAGTEGLGGYRPALKKLSCSRLREAELVDSKLGQKELGVTG